MQRRLHFLLPICLLLALRVTSAWASTAPSIAPGAGSFAFTDRQGDASKPITVWYFRPEGIDENAPIVFVVHGHARDPQNYRDAWAPLAQSRKFLLLCPEFSEKNYPSTSFALGNMFDRSGQPIPKQKWSYSVIEHLFDSVKAMTGSKAQSYYLYGHSAGGQFVHRFVLFLPEARFQRAIAANPGWYTMPALDAQKFPYGLKDSGETPDKLKQALGRNLVVLLGEKDVDPEDAVLRKTPEAEAQGKNRFDRGHLFYETGKETAARLGCPFAWKLKTVPGAAHSNPQMAPRAAEVLLGGE